MYANTFFYNLMLLHNVCVFLCVCSVRGRVLCVWKISLKTGFLYFIVPFSCLKYLSFASILTIFAHLFCLIAEHRLLLISNYHIYCYSLKMLLIILSLLNTVLAWCFKLTVSSFMAVDVFFSLFFHFLLNYARVTRKREVFFLKLPSLSYS